MLTSYLFGEDFHVDYFFSNGRLNHLVMIQLYESLKHFSHYDVSKYCLTLSLNRAYPAPAKSLGCVPMFSTDMFWDEGFFGLMCPVNFPLPFRQPTFSA